MKHQNEIQGMKEEYMKYEMNLEQQDKLLSVINLAKKENAKERKRDRIQRFGALAAVMIVGFVIMANRPHTVAYAMEKLSAVMGRMIKVVNFYEYKYEDDRHHADLEIPKLEIESIAEDTVVQEKIEEVTDEINEEIKEITDKIIAQFEAHIAEEMGYQEFVVKSEVLATTENCFTLKLMCYQGAGSGYQWNYYYTIDLCTGERLQLRDIFTEGADYITPISEEIKKQMQAQMKKDAMVTYWIDEEIEEWNFKTITDETSFYLNDENNVVIAFNEGEVAPMYMGAVEFEIPSEILENIRK